MYAIIHHQQNKLHYIAKICTVTLVHLLIVFKITWVSVSKINVDLENNTFHFASRYYSNKG